MREVTGRTYDKKRASGKCVVFGCSNKGIKRGEKFEKYCACCNRKLLKERHPYTYWYDINRSNAKRRGKPFVWTKDEFVLFCEQTNYLELKGRGAGRATLDCKNPILGYSYDNVRIMEHSDNSRKGWLDKKILGYHNSGRVMSIEEIDKISDEFAEFTKEMGLNNKTLKDYDF